MNDGEKVILVPGISMMREGGKYSNKARVNDTLEAMTEVVTIVKLYNGTGNAKVRDSKGVVFWCNSEDLSVIESNIS